MWTSTLLFAAASLSLVAGAPHEPMVLFKGLAMAKFNFVDFELTQVGLACERANSTTPYSCGLKFNWHDPNSVRQNNVSSTACALPFSWDGVNTIGSEEGFAGGPSVTCHSDDTSRFTSTLLYFKEPSNITIQLAHMYLDAENFTQPYVYPTTFAQPNLGLPQLYRSETEIKMFEEGLINATVVGVTI
ncbi:hypothetical protein QBC39DRAFT_334344 [Podospora conica]|nr:hypothetical protein QBC39DRAFT_334344 [Schizothecium conicum]